MTISMASVPHLCGKTDSPQGHRTDGISNSSHICAKSGSSFVLIFSRQFAKSLVIS